MSVKIKSAVGWSVIEKVINIFITLLISAFLARLILPEEFGLLSMVTVFTGFFVVFKNFGLGASIIYHGKVEKLELNSIFWFNIFISFLFSVIIFFLARPIADFYGNQRLIPITYAVSLLFFIQSIGIVPDTLIRKELQFKGFFIRNLSNNIVSGIIGIIFAFMGYGVWALIIKQFIGNIWTIIISFMMVDWRPKFEFNFYSLKKHFAFGLPLFGENFINYWTRNIDTLLVGKFLGEKTLGFYNRAYALMTLPLRQINSAIARVIFPAFSKINQDKDQLWLFYIKLLRLTAFITFPMMILLFILSKETILILYGKNWLPMVPILKGLSLLGAIQSLTSYSGTMFQVLGKTKQQFILGLFFKPFTIGSIFFGVWKYGIPGIIVALIVASVVSFTVLTHFISKNMGRTLCDVLIGLKKEIITSAILLGFFFLLHLGISSQINFIVVFTVISISYFMAYFLINYLLKTEGFQFLKKNIYERKNH